MASTARKGLDKEININLIPQQEIRGTLGKTLSWVIGIGRYFIIIAEIIALVTFGLSLKLTIDKNNLGESIKNSQAIIDSRAEFEAEFRTIQDKITNIKTIRANHFGQNQALDEFSKLLPQGIDLTSLDITETEISFGGSFPTAAQLHTMINSFNGSDKIVGLDITTLNSPSVEDPKFTFEAKATIVLSAFAIAEESGGGDQEKESN